MTDFLPMCLERAEQAREAGDVDDAKAWLRKFYLVRYLNRPASDYMGYVETQAFERWLTADQDIAARAREAGII